MVSTAGVHGRPAGKIDDARAEALASAVARKIEAELKYPGQIKVVVVRETRAVDYAK